MPGHDQNRTLLWTLNLELVARLWKACYHQILRGGHTGKGGARKPKRLSLFLVSKEEIGILETGRSQKRKRYKASPEKSEG